MSVKATAKLQYARRMDQAFRTVGDLKTPEEGWITTMRKALGMSGAQLARRAGVSRAAVYQSERNERAGAITLRQMDKLAEAMGGRLVYAIVPEESVEAVVRTQATKKATQLVGRASAHMALERQGLTAEQNEKEIARLAEELVRDTPSGFWDPDDA
jgi:predicted DNA-binding mobile mystery protein A